MAETTNEAALRIATRIIEQRDLLLAANFAGETTAAGEDLKGGWKPDLEPRWPKGTPGVDKQGHPLGGEFMQVADILGTIDKSISKSQNLTWLAKGSTRIQSINATRDGTELRMDITLKDGRTGQLHAIPDAPFDKLMGRLVQIDSGQRVLDQPQGAKPNVREPRSPVPDLTVPEGTQHVDIGHLPIPIEMLALVHSHERDPRNKWPPDKGDKADKYLGPFQHTIEMWTNNAGQWDPERRKLHEKILKELFAEFGEEDRAAEPTVMFTVGGPGSGKSTAREIDPKLLDMPPKTLHLDNDLIKLLLPEYGKMTSGQHPDPYAAYATHDEAAEIMQQAVVEAIKRGIHVHIDGTGDDNPGEFEKRMTTFSDANYKVRVTLFDTPTDLGIARTILGADARHGRWLSPNYVRETYEKVARSFLGWKDKGYIADWRMFSTLGEKGALTPIATNGGVEHSQFFDLFVQKAGGNHGRSA